MCSMRTPQRIAPHLLEDFHEARGDQRLLLGRDMGKGIVGVGLTGIGDVEVYEVVPTRFRYTLCHPLHEVTVGIDERAAPAREDVLHDQVFKQRRFTDARFADHVDMGKPVSLLDAERVMAIAGVGAGEDEGFFSVGHPFRLGLWRGLDRRVSLLAGARGLGLGFKRKRGIMSTI